MRNKKSMLAVAALLLTAAIFAGAYFLLRPQATAGEKTIHVEIVTGQGDAKTLKIHTEAEYLKEALEENSLIEGKTGATGFYVTTVDGIAANDVKKEWWSFSKNGEALTTYVDSTPIYDGDHYEITLVTGY
jgi:hypothetical protein